MLVITRKGGEGFSLGDNIEITILEVGRDRVKIGISAPKEITIVRNELKEAKEINIESSKTLSQDNIKQLLNINPKGGD